MKISNRGSTPATRKNGIGAVRGVLITALVLISVLAILSAVPSHVEALDPHIVTGTGFESNGTTCNNCNVTITNVRTGENSSGVTSNATGVYAYNLLNLPTGWAYGDTVQVTATNGTGSTGSNSTTLTIGDVSTEIDVWIGTTTVSTGVNFFVVDANGYPVESAMINIKDNSGDIVVTKITDSEGQASHELSNGLYIVTLSKSGYDDVVQTIRVHGTTYAFRMGVVTEAVVLTDFWYWAMVFLALIGVVALLSYISKKV